VFSNCEEIELLINGEIQGRFCPDYEQYPHLQHPPFTIIWPEPYNPWGTQSFDLEVRGYINDKCVAQHKIASDHLPHALRIASRTTHLEADGADMAWVTVQVVDKYGNVLPYQSVIVDWSLETDADAEFIGENPQVLLGGQGAGFVKAGHTAGTVTVQAQTVGLPPVSLQLDILEASSDGQR
jgi:beta-galactosidase